MKLKAKLLLICSLIWILLISCNSFPPDDSPAWSKNNRFGLEMENNCNLTTHSIGISGCAFKKDVGPDSFLKIPSFWSSEVNLISSKCGNYSYSLSKGKELNLELSKLNTVQSNCSFQINRGVTNLDKEKGDFPLIGRFFIKIIPNNKFYIPIEMEMGKNQFKGVGWYQRKPNTTQPPLLMYPKGTEGVILLKCGEEPIERMDFYERPIVLELSEEKSCDYEISVINDDSPVIEFGTVIIEQQGYTEDIKVPKTYTRFKSRHFNFEDNVNLNGDEVVVGIKVDNEYCASYKCKVRKGNTKYEVRAVTASMRYFYGVYFPKTNSWEIKND